MPRRAKKLTAEDKISRLTFNLNQLPKLNKNDVNQKSFNTFVPEKKSLRKSLKNSYSFLKSETTGSKGCGSTLNIKSNLSLTAKQEFSNKVKSKLYKDYESETAIIDDNYMM